VSLPSGARVRTTPPEAVGPQRATSTSPLWTLESLRLEPDDAAANADRGENHDPRGERQDEQRDDLTEEMRLENGSELARTFFHVCSIGRCGHVFGLSVRHTGRWP
jgi:hypothetical protein